MNKFSIQDFRLLMKNGFEVYTIKNGEQNYISIGCEIIVDDVKERTFVYKVDGVEKICIRKTDDVVYADIVRASGMLETAVLESISVATISELFKLCGIKKKVKPVSIQSCWNGETSMILENDNHIVEKQNMDRENEIETGNMTEIMYS